MTKVEEEYWPRRSSRRILLEPLVDLTSEDKWTAFWKGQEEKAENKLERWRSELNRASKDIFDSRGQWKYKITVVRHSHHELRRVYEGQPESKVFTTIDFYALVESNEPHIQNWFHKVAVTHLGELFSVKEDV